MIKFKFSKSWFPTLLIFYIYLTYFLKNLIVLSFSNVLRRLEDVSLSLTKIFHNKIKYLINQILG